MGAGAYQAVLFDFDGTLANTMPDNFRAWQAAVAEHGLQIEPEDYYQLEGLRVIEVGPALFRRYRREPPDPAVLVRKKEQHYLVHHRFALYPGVEELLARLQARRVLTGLVTAGLPERLRRTTPSGFLSLFDAVVTGDDTVDGKPSPAPYLCGAEKLGVQASACIVVENAPLGIQSAKRAGAYCIALCTTLARQQLAEADEVIQVFEDLKDSMLIRELLA